jgi:histidinol phosphatase-like enzyme
MDFGKTIIFWDNDGTIMGSIDPDDKSPEAKIILPNVKQLMNESKLNVIVSGILSKNEDNCKDFDPKNFEERFLFLIRKLPITAAAFSPKRWGTACHLFFKPAFSASGLIDPSVIFSADSLDSITTSSDRIFVLKAHEEQQYSEYIGKFKKPDIGMFVVMKDLLSKYYGHELEDICKVRSNRFIMIGDMPQDQGAAEAFGIEFIHAKEVHDGKFV